MEQTNVVQMPEQKPEREPWERNVSIPTEQEQLFDLESRLKTAMYQRERSDKMNENLNNELSKIEANWKFIANNIQPFLTESVSEDRVYEITEEKVDDYITYSSRLVTEDNFSDFFDTCLDETSIDIKEVKLERT